MTTFAVHDAKSACSLVKWCDNARTMANYTNADVVVYTDSAAIVQQLCPYATMRSFDPGLLRAIEMYTTKYKSSHWSSHDLCADTLLKFSVLTATEYNSVLFLDADIDSSFGKVDRRSTLMNDMAGYIRNFTQAPCQMRATPDHSALINDGVMLLKPSMSVYRSSQSASQTASKSVGLSDVCHCQWIGQSACQCAKCTRAADAIDALLCRQALRVMRRGNFSKHAGYDGAGPPKMSIPNPHPLVMRAMGYWKNNWNFVCSGGSQG